MKKNDFPTNPVAFAQYVWENVEDGDKLMDRLQNIWEVSSYTIFDGRKIEINLCCVDSSEWAGGYYNGKRKKLTRYDLARKYYLYIDDKKVEIPTVKDWNTITFVQNYNTIWSILDTMNSPLTSFTKEEKEDIYNLFLLTQEADEKYQGKIEQLSTLRTLDGLKNKIEKETKECLSKEDTEMNTKTSENEKNYFPKNKGKTNVDTHLKSAFYSDEEFCTRLVDTFFNASDFSKKTLGELKNFLKEKHNDYKNDYENYIKEKSKKEPKPETQSETKIINVNDSKPTITIDNNDTATGTYKVSNTDTEQPKPVFKLGDVVNTNDNSVGYISRIGYTDKYCYYYWTPLVVSFKDRNNPCPLEVGKELGLTYPYETHYKRIGNYLMSDLNCVKEMARIDSVYKLSEDNLKKFPYLDKYVNDCNDKKDSNTSTPNDTASSSNRKTIGSDSLPNYLGRLNLTDSAYSFEVNTKLTTTTACKLNEVIEAFNDVIWYIQETERKRHLEER